MYGSFYYTQLTGVPGMVTTFRIDSNTNYYKERQNATSFSLKPFKDSPKSSCLSSGWNRNLFWSEKNLKYCHHQSREKKTVIAKAQRSRHWVTAFHGFEKDPNLGLSHSRKTPQPLTCWLTYKVELIPCSESTFSTLKSLFTNSSFIQ